MHCFVVFQRSICASVQNRKANRERNEDSMLYNGQEMTRDNSQNGLAAAFQRPLRYSSDDSAFLLELYCF